MVCDEGRWCVGRRVTKQCVKYGVCVCVCVCVCVKVVCGRERVTKLCVKDGV